MSSHNPYSSLRIRTGNNARALPASKNWRNFWADSKVRDRLPIIDPNASGKSKLLNALLSVKRVAPERGGFQKAVENRERISRVRCLEAGGFNHGRTTIEKVLVNRRAGRPEREHEAGTSSPSGRCRAVSTPHGDRNPCRKPKPGAGRRLTAGILVPEAKARFYKNRFARPQGALRNERDFRTVRSTR